MAQPRAGPTKSLSFILLLPPLAFIDHLQGDVNLFYSFRIDVGSLENKSQAVMIDGLVKSPQKGRHSKKLRMQGARILRNEAYLKLRCNDEG
jgi:hypothetical protein